MAPSSFARLLGWLFLLFGIAGFFSDRMLFMFEVNTTLNILHIITAIVAFLFIGIRIPISFLKLCGIVYGAIAIIGFAMGGSVLGILQINRADSVLYVVIAALCLFIGFTASGAKKA